MIGTVRVEKISKTYWARERKGLFNSVKRPVKALKEITLEDVFIAKTGRTLAEDTSKA